MERPFDRPDLPAVLRSVDLDKILGEESFKDTDRQGGKGMKITSPGIVMVAALTALLSADPAMAQGLDSCIENGQEAGRKAGTTFCDVLEARYRATLEGKPATRPFILPVQVCDAASVAICKRAMAEFVRNERPACSKLVREDWQGAKGEWDLFQQDHCKRQQK